MSADLFQAGLIALDEPGRFDVPGFRFQGGLDEVRRRANYLIETSRTELAERLRDRPIYFDFQDSYHLNGIAFAHAGIGFMSITAGTPFILRFVFNRMLADRRVLPEIGDATKESDTLPPIVLGDTGLGPHLGVLFKQRFAKPKDEDRAAYAEHLTYTATEFLIIHELAHLIHGHIDYLNDRCGLSHVKERGVPLLTPEQALLLQTLEFDADFDASSVLAMNCHKRLRDSSGRDVRIRPIDNNKDKALFSYLFAVGTLWRLFGDGVFAAPDLTGSDHPPSRLRYTMSLAAFCAVFAHSDLDGVDRTGTQATQQRAIRAIEHAHAIVTGSTFSTAGLAQSLGADGRDHSRRLQQNWEKSLRSEVLPFAWVKNLRC